MKKKNQNIIKRLQDMIDFSKSSKATLYMFIEIWAGVIVIIASLLLFLHLANEVLRKETISFDNTIIHGVYLLRNPLMTDIMRWITFFGSGEFVGPVLIITIALLIWGKHRKDATVFGFLLIFGAGLNVLMKNIFQRARPDFMPLVFEPSYSFPSGHSMNSCIFYTALAFFIFRKIRNKLISKVLIILSVIIILLIGISRIYLGAHYPSDVLGGYIAGALWFGVVVLFEKTLILFRLFQDYELKKKYSSPL